MKISNQATKNKKRAKYEIGDFCIQYDLPSIAPSKRKTKDRHPSNQAYSRNHRRFKKSNNLGKDYFYKRKTRKTHRTSPKGKDITKTALDKKNVKCYKCGKKGHFKSKCRVKALINTLQGNRQDKEELIKILELKSIDSESDSSSDNDIFRINQSSSSDYQSTSIESSNNPKIKLGCKDSCCQNKVIDALSKQ